MTPNNRKWYTLFVKDAITHEWDVFAHVRGIGNANVVVYALNTMPNFMHNIRTAEGQHSNMTDELKLKLLY